MTGSSRRAPIGVTVVLLGATAIAGWACKPANEVARVSNRESEEARPIGAYLGEDPPGVEPQLFAPGIVSTGGGERDMAITPDGKELYYTAVLGGSYAFSAIVGMSETDSGWIGPEVVPFSGNYMDLEPALTIDGQQMYFVSRRPLEAGGDPTDNEDIWLVARSGGSWGEPQNLGPPINTPQPEFFPSLTRDGTLYFTRRGVDGTEAIYRARRVDDSYDEPERLGPEVNSAPTQFNAFIAPDESYLIVCLWGAEDGLGGSDYYVVYRSPEDEWSQPINLGPKINTETAQEWSPYVSPDGRYFFFMASRAAIENRYSPRRLSYGDLGRLHNEPMNGNYDIWWVDAGFLEELRSAER